MKYLEEKALGFDTGVGPGAGVVPAAILFDLAIRGKHSVRPDDPYMGYSKPASTLQSGPVPRDASVLEPGATAGMRLAPNNRPNRASGLSQPRNRRRSRDRRFNRSNPFGDVYDPETGKIIAGTRSIHKGLINMGDEPIFANTKSFLKTTIGKTVVSFASSHIQVIGVVPRTPG